MVFYYSCLILIVFSLFICSDSTYGVQHIHVKFNDLM